MVYTVFSHHSDLYFLMNFFIHRNRLICSYINDLIRFKFNQFKNSFTKPISFILIPLNQSFNADSNGMIIFIYQPKKKSWQTSRTRRSASLVKIAGRQLRGRQLPTPAIFAWQANPLNFAFYCKPIQNKVCEVCHEFILPRMLLPRNFFRQIYEIIILLED